MPTTRWPERNRPYPCCPQRRAAQAPALIEPAVKALDAALTALDDARQHLDAALRTANHDPRDLEKIEERLFGLRAAARKHNVPVDQLNALAARYAAELALIDAGAERLAALEQAASAADAQYREAAAALSRDRKKAAETLDRAVNDELKALKVVLADRGSASTLVFDEVDTGAGGAVADAIGVRLARLSSRAQVIAVTHAPQVAARADRHYLISKSALDKGKRVATRVTELAAEKRREEVARMLAGAEIPAEARAAAERLIKAAG